MPWSLVPLVLTFVALMGGIRCRRAIDEKKAEAKIERLLQEALTQPWTMQNHSPHMLREMAEDLEQEPVDPSRLEMAKDHLRMAVGPKLTQLERWAMERKLGQSPHKAAMWMLLRLPEAQREE